MGGAHEKSNSRVGRIPVANGRGSRKGLCSQFVTHNFGRNKLPHLPWPRQTSCAALAASSSRCCRDKSVNISTMPFAGSGGESWCVACPAKHLKDARFGAEVDPCHRHWGLRQVACRTLAITLLHRTQAPSCHWALSRLSLGRRLESTADLLHR